MSDEIGHADGAEAVEDPAPANHTGDDSISKEHSPIGTALSVFLAHGTLLAVSFTVLWVWLSYGASECPRPSLR